MDLHTLEAYLPVLGEPAPIELANTHYRDGDETIEFLATASLVSAWFAASPTAQRLDPPPRWSTEDRRRLIELRDAIDDSIRARIDRRAPDRVALDRLNAAAGLAVRTVELEWDDHQAPRRVEQTDAPHRVDSVLSTLAVQTIELLAGPDAELLRVCANDDCELLFLRHHHRRRWCHNSCGHRHRQAAYYRSRLRSREHTGGT